MCHGELTEFFVSQNSPSLTQESLSLTQNSPSFQERKFSPKRKFLAGYPCGHPAKNFGQALQILEKNKHFGTDIPCGRPSKNLGLQNFGLIFRSLSLTQSEFSLFETALSKQYSARFLERMKTSAKGSEERRVVEEASSVEHQLLYG